MFYLTSCALFSLGGLLTSGTSPLSRLGCYEYDKKRVRREIGLSVIAVAFLFLGMAVLAQLASSLL